MREGHVNAFKESICLEADNFFQAEQVVLVAPINSYILCDQCDITNREGLNAGNANVRQPMTCVTMFSLVLASVLIASGKKPACLDKTAQKLQPKSPAI